MSKNLALVIKCLALTHCSDALSGGFKSLSFQSDVWVSIRDAGMKLSLRAFPMQCLSLGCEGDVPAPDGARQRPLHPKPTEAVH